MNELNQIGHCDVGHSVITKGYGLKAKYVIHTVGPRVWNYCWNFFIRMLLRLEKYNVFKVTVKSGDIVPTIRFI